MSLSKEIDLKIRAFADNKVGVMCVLDRIITEGALEYPYPICPLSTPVTDRTLKGISENSGLAKAMLKALKEHAQVLNRPNVYPEDVEAWAEARDSYINEAPKTGTYRIQTPQGKDRRYVHDCLVRGVQPEWKKLKAEFDQQWEVLIVNHQWHKLLHQIEKEKY